MSIASPRSLSHNPSTSRPGSLGRWTTRTGPPIYWTNALVYLLPWLSRGFELDRFSIACLVAGVIHIQVR